MSNAKVDAAVIEVKWLLEEPHRLLQLAEEAAELSQIATKLARILMGRNPSPMAEDTARAKLLDEYNDVRVCALTLNLPDHVMPGKLFRWVERLRNRK